MAEALYLDFPQAKTTVEKMQKDTDEIKTKIGEIMKNMEALHESWRGSGYQKRKSEFDSDFKPAMDKMASSAVQFNEMLNKCMQELKNLDDQLAGA